ncbi:MAG: AAA family ATPase [Candidatus Acidiferrales bacterium]
MNNFSSPEAVSDPYVVDIAEYDRIIANLPPDDLAVKIARLFEQIAAMPATARVVRTRRQTIPDLRKAAATKTVDVIEGMLPQGSVNIIVGDSGIGKTPLVHQMAYAVGAGVPFVGFNTRKAPVLIADFENSVLKRLELNERVLACMKIPDPENVEFFASSSPDELVEEIRRSRPGLCIIDTLRLFDPAAEMRSVDAASLIGKLRWAADASGTAFLVIHHPRKPSQERNVQPPKLIETPVLEWLQQAAGSRALVNQADVRIGLDGGREDEPLIMRGYRKIDGEFGPISLIRTVDAEGDPLGYQRLSGIQLLPRWEHQRAFAELPHSFRFTDAQRALGTDSGSVPKRFLRSCLEAGLIVKAGRLYRKRE